MTFDEVLEYESYRKRVNVWMYLLTAKGREYADLMIPTDKAPNLPWEVITPIHEDARNRYIGRVKRDEVAA